MKDVARHDKGEIRGEAEITPEGYIRANAVVTRSGIFNYQNLDGSIRRELRHPNQVWDNESIKSMALIPVTNGHPRERMVTPKNFKHLAIGYTGETINKDDEFVMANFVITDQDGIDAVVKFGRKELSLGYLVDLDETPGEYEGEKYDAIQTNIRYNHLAIVDKARAGKEARIALDSFDAVEIKNEDKNMSKRKVKIDNEEMEVEESVASYVERLERDLKNLTDERARVESEIAMIRDKLEKTQGERDSFKDQVTEMDKSMSNNMDEAKFNKAVKDRVQLLSLATEFLGSGVASKLDSMSDLDIKKEVIRSAKKSVNVDGKSQVYLDCMFDMIIDQKAEKKVNVDNVTIKNENNDSSTGSVLQKAQGKMMNYNKNLINQKSGE